MAPDGPLDITQAAPAPAPGGSRGLQRIEHYRIVRELGAGGMGCVFEAYDEKLHRPVALKVLAAHLSASGHAGARFQQEAWIAGRLDHPNVVQVYDRGTTGECQWIAMEYVGGGSLADVVQNLKRSGRDERWGLVAGTRECVVWAIERVVQAARGLDHAHRRGVVHRDVKPGNLLLEGEGGAVKVADFGIALEVDATQLTTAGGVLGTAAYMPPEQILGERERIGVASDVYALAVTLFELLTLELPFSGQTQQMYLQSVLTGEARRAGRLNARVGADLETVLRKALEKDPRDRYASCAAFGDDLLNVLQFRPIVARRPGIARRAEKWVRRRPVHAALLGLALVSVPTIAVLGQRALEHRRLVVQQRVEREWKEVRWLFAQTSRTADARAKAGELLRGDPDHVPALRVRALAGVRLAREARDPAAIRRLQEESLADLGRLVALAPDVAWPYRLRALALRQFDRAEQARADEASALARSGGATTDEDLDIDALVAFEAGDYGKTVALLSQLLARRPNSPPELYRRARAFEQLGNVESAIVDYRVAVALDPDDFATQAELGRLLTASGAPEEGERFLARAAELKPGAFEVDERLAENAIALGRRATADPAAARARFESAVRFARRAIGENPDSAWARINLGAALMELYRIDGDARVADEAIGQYERARALLAARSGEDAPAARVATLINLCDARIQLGRAREAVESCRAAAAAAPGSATAFYNLAGAYALAGRPDEALGALARDVELGDTDAAYLAADPWFAGLRQDARFRDLLERMRRGS
ncbi:MAG: protein kinase [Acidobacteria bacterium]|nr:protein kinase [Acidobacteriota bacterium]